MDFLSAVFQVLAETLTHVLKIHAARLFLWFSLDWFPSSPSPLLVLFFCTARHMKKWFFSF